MPLLEHLIDELQKLAVDRNNIRLKGEAYDEIVDAVEQASKEEED